MRYIKEDYLENIEQDDIVASEDSSKDLPEAKYNKEYDGCDQGIDGVLNKVRSLVDKNLKELDEKIRAKLYGSLGITEDNLIRIESFEYNGQLTYTMTYSKKNDFYPEFFVVHRH